MRDFRKCSMEIRNLLIYIKTEKHSKKRYSQDALELVNVFLKFYLCTIIKNLFTISLKKKLIECDQLRI